jgi:hypothetical protein
MTVIYVLVNTRVICSDAVVRNLCSMCCLYLFVRLLQFCGAALVICFLNFHKDL